MEDICNFIPAGAEYYGGIRFYHFVYEASYRRLRQPFVHDHFYAHLAFKGKAVLRSGGREYSIMPGTLFFTFPAQVYSLEGDGCFTYLYVTFNGADAGALLQKFHITGESFVFPGMEHLLDFWMGSIRKLTEQNASTLTESVLLYSLSCIDARAEAGPESADRFEQILGYVHSKYTGPGLSIGAVADMFFYSKKYLSALFVKRTGVRFTEYLNSLRVRHAEYLMSQLPDAAIAEIAARCGYSSPFYFSKVFKKMTGRAPVEYMRDCHSSGAERLPSVPPGA